MTSTHFVDEKFPVKAWGLQHTPLGPMCKPNPREHSAVMEDHSTKKLRHRYRVALVRLGAALPGVTPVMVESTTICSGSLNNCYFVAAVAAVASKNSSAIAHLFSDLSDGPNGKYEVRFFHRGHWTAVVIDDIVPVLVPEEHPGPQWPHVIDEPHRHVGLVLPFARGLSESSQQLRLTLDTLWPTLLEKAYAKLLGGYDKFQYGGSMATALLHLTGFGCDVIELGADRGAFTTQQFASRALGCSLNCATDARGSDAHLKLEPGHAYVISQSRTSTGCDAVTLCDTRHPTNARTVKWPNIVDSCSLLFLTCDAISRFQSPSFAVDVETKQLQNKHLVRLPCVREHLPNCSRTTTALHAWKSQRRYASIGDRGCKQWSFHGTFCPTGPYGQMGNGCWFKNAMFLMNFQQEVTQDSEVPVVVSVNITLSRHDASGVTPKPESNNSWVNVTVLRPRLDNNSEVLLWDQLHPPVTLDRFKVVARSKYIHGHPVSLNLQLHKVRQHPFLIVVPSTLHQPTLTQHFDLTVSATIDRNSSWKTSLASRAPGSAVRMNVSPLCWRCVSDVAAHHASASGEWTAQTSSGRFIPSKASTGGSGPASDFSSNPLYILSFSRSVTSSVFCTVAVHSTHEPQPAGTRVRTGCYLFRTGQRGTGLFSPRKRQSSGSLAASASASPLLTRTLSNQALARNANANALREHAAAAIQTVDIDLRPRQKDAVGGPFKFSSIAMKSRGPLQLDPKDLPFLLVPCTYDAGQTGNFTLSVHCSVPVTLTRVSARQARHLVTMSPHARKASRRSMQAQPPTTHSSGDDEADETVVRSIGFDDCDD